MAKNSANSDGIARSLCLPQLLRAIDGMENLVTTTGPYHRGAVRLGLDAAGGVDVGQPVGPL